MEILHRITCYMYFKNCSKEGLCPNIHTKLVEEFRAKAGRKKAQTLGNIVLKSGKTSAQKASGAMLPERKF